MGKEEIARFEQFLFFCHYVFKKPSAAEASESVYMRERVNDTLRRFRLVVITSFSGKCISSTVLFIVTPMHRPQT